MPRVPRFFFQRSHLTLFLVFCCALSSFATDSRYRIGSSNTVTADPTVPRPGTTPCVVQLFQDVPFENFNPYDFQFTPPANCPGPWLKVVFTADISVTKGVQYDRTANFWIGGANIYFGTTAEPSTKLGPHWHVETDLTDYSALFTVPQNGQADIGNLVNGQYTGVIYAGARLLFYPVGTGGKAPKTFDMVLPMSAGPDGGTVGLASSTDMLSGTFTLPTNVVGAYLDVFAQSQSSDEFWYTCVPNDVSGELESCGNTAFREGEVTIDGQPAGVAPIYPWIYTGGIDPYLWFPLPGVQTLNFIPYRVNLTPFAGLLSNGQPHTVALSVYNADNYFSATASLLLTLDPNTSQVTGQVTQNTLTANPSPQVQENIKNNNGDISGTVSVDSNRNFTIAGYVMTKSGMKQTTITQNINFSNLQGFNINSSKYIQNISQLTDITSWTTTTDNSGSKQVYVEDSYPLSLDIDVAINKDGSADQTTTIRQEDRADGNTQVNGTQIYSFTSDNVVAPTDTLEISAGGFIIGNKNQSSSQQYQWFDSNGKCYDRSLGAAGNKLTRVTYGCKGGKKSQLK